jgi:hypothetical protein
VIAATAGEWHLSILLQREHGMLAYVGLGPGQELIPYFLGLLAWAGAAFLAVLQWPIYALRQRLARRRQHTAEPVAVTVQESADDGSRPTS